MIFAIDPGTFQSGWVLVKEDLSGVVKAGKSDNEELRKIIQELAAAHYPIKHFAIEMIASYGMPVGRETFETCLWIGRFSELIEFIWGNLPTLIYRKEEKLCICNAPRANDATIKQALIDRFAYGTRNYGKGTKQEPGYFYGFSKDMWQAFAVAVTYHNKYIEKGG